MDDNLPMFLSNPEKVGAEHPLWLKYLPELELYSKNIRTGTFAKDGRVTSRSGMLKLGDLRTETDATTKQEYWQLPPENGYVPKGQTQPELLSQYDLEKLGFRTEIVEPSSFDYLDGKTQPVGLVRRIFEWMLEEAKNDPRPSHAMADHLASLLNIRLDDGQVALFRYYDPGVLHSINTLLSEEQRAHFLTGIEQWHYRHNGEHFTLTPFDTVQEKR